MSVANETNDPKLAPLRTKYFSLQQSILPRWFCLFWPNVPSTDRSCWSHRLEWMCSFLSHCRQSCWEHIYTFGGDAFWVWRSHVSFSTTIFHTKALLNISNCPRSYSLNNLPSFKRIQLQLPVQNCLRLIFWNVCWNSFAK